MSQLNTGQCTPTFLLVPETADPLRVDVPHEVSLLSPVLSADGDGLKKLVGVMAPRLELPRPFTIITDQAVLSFVKG